MVKKVELTDFKHGKIIGFYKAGDFERTISKKTGYGKTTIHNIIVKYHETGTVTIASRSGRPKKLTEQDKWYLKAIINKNRYEPEKKIRKIFIGSTEKDISRALYNEYYIKWDI